MAIRILILIALFLLVTNLVLMLVGFFTGVNLYKKYGEQIIKFYIGFALLIVIIYLVLGGLALGIVNLIHT